MTRKLVSSLLFLLIFCAELRSGEKVPKLFSYDPNYVETEEKNNPSIYRMDKVVVKGELIQFPDRPEKDLDNAIKKLSAGTSNSFLKKVSIIPDGGPDTYQGLDTEYFGAFPNSHDALKYRDVFEVDLPGGQNLKIHFKSSIAIKFGDGKIVFRPSRKKLISYYLDW